MLLVLAIVQNEDAGGLIDALTQKGLRSTRMNTAGGFLKESNATIVLGLEPEQVEDVLSVIRGNCHTRTQYLNPLPPVMEPGEFYMPYPVEVQVGGATVFVIDVESYRQL
ncbi:MAG: cyclic-di-AMP receptor [Chloroflexota bacterium]